MKPILLPEDIHQSLREHRVAYFLVRQASVYLTFHNIIAHYGDLHCLFIIGDNYYANILIADNF